MMRLFVGVPLPADVRERVAALCAGLPGARWVAPQNLHVTLRFIGEVDNGEAEDIDAALSAIRVPAFALRLSGIGFFDRGRAVHAVWVGLEASDGLIHLHDKVESAIVRAGCEPERRKYKPHVTLARLRKTPVKRIGGFLETCNGFAAGPFTADRFTLFRSHLGQEGAHHESLADYPLLGA